MLASPPRSSRDSTVLPSRPKPFSASSKRSTFPSSPPRLRKPPPGKITLIAVAADEPAGKPVADCKKQTVCLTLHRGKIDDLLFQQHGPAAFRQARILDLCQQALSQGALLTAEDLAYRVFFVTPRTISRDLIVGPPGSPRRPDPDAQHPPRPRAGAHPSHSNRPPCTPRQDHLADLPDHAPLSRGGRQLSVHLHALRPTRRTRRCRPGRSPSSSAADRPSIKAYLEILAECQRDRNMAYHLDELLRIGSCGGEKKIDSWEVRP